MPPTHDDFRRALHERFARALREGRETVEVSAGALHREVGGYPVRDGNHRIRTCCMVMLSEKTESDRIISIPPSGFGASLTIRFRLPRTSPPETYS